MGSVVGATIATDGVVWTMSDWVAEWVTNPNPSTRGTIMTIEFRDGSTMVHTVVEDETVHHDAVGVWLQTVTGAGRERVVEHRTFVWHDVSYLRLQLVQELKIRSPDPSMQGLNTTWHVDQRPGALRFWNWDGPKTIEVTVMDYEPVTAGVASLGGPPPEVVALARVECGR